MIGEDSPTSRHSDGRESIGDSSGNGVRLAVPETLRHLRRADICSLEDACDQAAAAVGGELVVLVRDTVALLLGAGSAVPTAHEVSHDVPSLGGRERAVLEFAERFVLDVASLTDEEVAGVAAVCTPAELYGVVVSIYLVEYSIRLELISAALFGPEREVQL